MPVNDEIVEGLLSYSGITCDDLEALLASVANCMSMSSPWIDEILALEGEIVLQGYLA